MSKKIEYTIQGEIDKRDKMLEAWQMVNKGLESGPVVVTLSRPKRSNPANALMWVLLGEISRQVVWYGQKLSDEDWKNVCTASLTKQSAVPGIDGGVVMVGRSTSGMDKAEFSDLIQVIYAFGAEQGVQFTDRVSADYQTWLEKIGVENAQV